MTKSEANYYNYRININRKDTIYESHARYARNLILISDYKLIQLISFGINEYSHIYMKY